jgi:hypothetical protein
MDQFLSIIFFDFRLEDARRRLDRPASRRPEIQGERGWLRRSLRAVTLLRP